MPHNSVRTGDIDYTPNLPIITIGDNNGQLYVWHEGEYAHFDGVEITWQKEFIPFTDAYNLSWNLSCTIQSVICDAWS